MIRFIKRKLILILLISLFAIGIQAQNTYIHKQSAEYDWPSDPLVLKKLDHWRDLKFGVLFHWGLYAVPGIVESWALCSEPWITRYGHENYQEFKNWYWGLSKVFDPVKFDPYKWADLMQQAGMRYMIFTTKHHDGFCMYDSKYTDFSIAKGPFKNNPRVDVAKYVFDAFRKDGFMIGAYFSKPDWHNQDYWWDYYATPDRNVNYDIHKFPERWNAFKSYVYNQIGELTDRSRYGAIDLLWLDGGWVCKENRQDIDMPKIAGMARAKQPGILIVDRTVHGPYENYQTPEQSIPDKQLSYPWESCITLTQGWGWVKNPEYKPVNNVLSMLVEVVAKGGNLLLGVGPNAEGTIDEATAVRLEKIGAWLHKNGKAIYNTVITPDYRSGNVWFTADKNEKTLYAVYALKEGEKIPQTIKWKGNLPRNHSKIRLLASGETIPYKVKDGNVSLYLPKKYVNSGDLLAFEFIH